jgi:hypothetical protein
MILCPGCSKSNEASHLHCGYCGAKLVQVLPPEPASSDVSRLKDNLKELKLAKKEARLGLKRVNEEMRKIRAQYTDEVRQRGSKIQGGGSIGRTIRLFQTAARDARKRSLSDALAPLEQSKRNLEETLLRIDGLILETERALS